MVMLVTLTWSEVRVSALTGIDRNIRALHFGRRRRFGDASSWDDNIIGALAECALAKYLDRYPSRGPEPDYAGDVGPLQVRATARASGSLIVHPADPDAARFVLVRGDAPALALVGWIEGAAAKLDRYWRADVPHPAYFVPEGVLRPISELGDR